MQRVVAVLERLKPSGLPQMIKVDNYGSEFISKALGAWAHQHGREARVQSASQYVEPTNAERIVAGWTTPN